MEITRFNFKRKQIPKNNNKIQPKVIVKVQQPIVLIEDELSEFVDA